MANNMRQASQRSNTKKKGKQGGPLKACCFFIMVVIVVLLIVGFLADRWYVNAIYSPNSSNSATATVQVNTGDTLESVANLLQDKGVIQSALALRIYIKLNNVSANIEPGTYQVPMNQTLNQVITDLEQGTLKPSITVTIPDGTRDEAIAAILDQDFNDAGSQRKFDKASFVAIIQNPDSYTFKSSVQTFLNAYKPEGKPLTGFIFPDTYQFYDDATSQDVIEIILDNFSKKLSDNNITPNSIQAHQNVLSSFYDVLTLASIVQKESGKIGDSPKIASVFYNRLADNYPLESDVTVNYALNNSAPISVQDTQVNSPYNTYLHSGLTPTPICSVNMATLLATLQPANTDYFFFIYDSNGNAFFSKTFIQHVNNVNNHL